MPGNAVSLEQWKAMPEEEKNSSRDSLYKGYVAEEIKVIEADRQIRFVISTDAVDRDKDTIAVDGWELSDFRKNPAVLWAHSYTQPPVARAVDIGPSDGKLKSLAEFPARETHPFADTVYSLLKTGFLNATSVGFRPLEWTTNEERGGIDFKKQTLLEFSIVPVPSNPQALIEARSQLGPDIMQPLIEWCEETLDVWHEEKGLWLPKSKVEEAFSALNTKRHVDMHVEPEPDDEVKYVPRDVSRSTAPQNTDWSRPVLGDFTDEAFEDLSATQRRRIGGHFAFSTNNPPDTFGNLKLPHHRARDGSVVFRGVAAAMGALLGARGGVDIPDDERRAVYNHLVSHYRQFSKEPPEFRFVEAQVLKHLPEIYDLDDDGQLVKYEEVEGEVVDDGMNDFLASVFDEHNNNNNAPLLADLDADDLRSAVGTAVGELVTDALKTQITSITGRLID